MIDYEPKKAIGTYWPTRKFSERGMWAKEMPDSEVPWWAISLLDFKKLGPHHERVFKLIASGKKPGITFKEFWDYWADCIEAARDKVMKRSIDDWIQLAYEHTNPDGEGDKLCEMIRHAALSNVRSFGQFAGWVDDDGNPIVFKDFHVKAINVMRRSKEPACLLLPYEHGKSYLGSMVVPLMDWAEWKDATEGRLYLSESHAKKWIRRLMGQVEHNENLHKLFPWIRKPQKGDATYKVWSTRGFAIGGRTLPDMSFEPLTAQQYPTGNRYHRIGCDDWVQEGNASQVTVMDRLFDYLHSGALTMMQSSTRTSKYGTAWPGFYICGTLFNPNDVNARAFNKFKSLGYRTMRVDVFVNRTGEKEVIWPEYRSLDHVIGLRRRLGERVFNMRCRNMLHGTKTQVFPEEVVRAAEHDGTHGDEPYEWKVVPERTRLMIGFDPGSGKITRDSKNPAYCVYGAQDISPTFQGTLVPKDPRVFDQRANPTEEQVLHHIIEWGRLDGYSFTRQCEKLSELSQFYGCPVAVEDNNVQTAYANYMNVYFPQTKIVNHTTHENKRDPRDGVEQFEPLFANRLVIIHAKDAPQEQLLALHSELTMYPGRYTDLVMALWIARFQFQKRAVLERPTKTTQYISTPGKQLIGGFGRYLRRG